METSASPHPTPRWSSLPPERPGPAPPRRVAPIVVPLVLVALLWLVGLHEVAVVALVLVAAVTTVTLVSPAARERIDRAASWLGHHVGRVLTVVLLGLVQLLVFAPVALFSRLTRSDPMDPLAGRRVESRWLARSGNEKALPARPYGDERYRRDAAGGVAPVGSLRWIRGIVGGLVLLLAADVALGSLIVRIGRDDAEAAIDGPVFGFDPLAQEALRNQANAEALFVELAQVGIGREDPFTGWRFHDGVTHASELVTVEGGIRRTIPATQPDSTAEVWFFGGSTMYGSGQADDATIPSVLARTLASDGQPINATNFGHPAYAQWQQVQLLEAELTAGDRPLPSVVVFYDGFNELTLQTQRGVHDEPTHLFFDIPAAAPIPTDDTVAGTVRRWWADHSAAALAVDRVRDAFRDDPAIQVADIDAPPIETIDPLAAADAAVAIHRRGVDHVIALGEAYGFEPLFLWQPFLYTKDPLTPAEQDLVGLPGYDVDVWFPMTDRVRARLADPVVDLSDALDGIDESLFWDFVHTNEDGAAAIAAAIHPHLAEVLGEM